MGMKMVGVDALINAFEETQKIMADEIKLGLAYLGEECVKQIREKGLDEGSWHDRTGNLRSSTGYTVVDHGRNVITSSFQSVQGPSGNGKQGAQIGHAYVEELAKMYADVYVLLIVAGMDYAEAVEAKGYDVLAGAKIHAEQRLNTVLGTFAARADRKINAMLKKL